MASHRSRVLIVDDEDNIVLALHRVLYQDNHRYDVLLARSAEIAQAIMMDVSIDVLVTDVQLPEKSGMDLLCWAAVESPTTRVIVMTAFDVAGIKDRAHAHGCLRLMRKPFDVHEMRSTILRALDRRDAFAGNLADLSAIDVIQMLCMARKTTTLRISEGTSSGVILIENGQVIHAIWDDYIGDSAFYRMMGVKNGLFYTSPLPPDIEHTIQGDWQFHVMEGLRRLDEIAAGLVADEPAKPSVRFSPFSLPPAKSTPPPGAAGQSWPPSDAEPRVVTPTNVWIPDAPPLPLPAPPRTPDLGAQRGRAEIAKLIDEGFEALRSGRRDDARRSWEEALRLDPANRMIELNLRKLDGMASPLQRR